MHECGPQTYQVPRLKLRAGATIANAISGNAYSVMACHAWPLPVIGVASESGGEVQPRAESQLSRPI